LAFNLHKIEHLSVIIPSPAELIWKHCQLAQGKVTLAPVETLTLEHLINDSLGRRIHPLRPVVMTRIRQCSVVLQCESPLAAHDFVILMCLNNINDLSHSTVGTVKLDIATLDTVHLA
jgi:hypothetical protein